MEPKIPQKAYIIQSQLFFMKKLAEVQNEKG